MGSVSECHTPTCLTTFWHSSQPYGYNAFAPPCCRVPVCVFYVCSLQHHIQPTDILYPSVGVTGGTPIDLCGSVTFRRVPCSISLPIAFARLQCPCVVLTMQR